MKRSEHADYTGKKYDDYLNFAQTIFNARNNENDND